MKKIPTVIQAVAGADYTVYAYFDDGSIHLLDAKPLLAKGGVFEPLKDEAFFQKRITVMNGTVAWDTSGKLDPRDCIDLDPCAIYDACPAVPDPLDAAG